jgi:hypothetical protein
MRFEIRQRMPESDRWVARMKNHDDTEATPIFPQRIRDYLTFNLSLAVLIAVVMAVRMELRTGRVLLIDFLLFSFYIVVLAAVFLGPVGVVEAYLYRRKKGVWYEWKHRTKRTRRDRAISADERRYWKSEAVRARLSGGAEPQEDQRDRTRLFESKLAADAVSRAALLMTVADKFERSGKKEAAERSYMQIIQQFADSPQAQEAARRLSTLTKI